MNNSLFFITIGPVKATIGNSRKMRDMYAGSFLLSYLMLKAIEELKKEKNIEIIIPIIPAAEINENTNGLNIPNKIIAKVENCNDDEKLKLAKKIADHINKEFLNICKKVFDEAGVEPTNETLAQLERCIEVYWLFEDYDGDYISAYKRLVSKMRSIKNLRPFKQINEPAGRKCSLYPENNVLFYKKTAKEKLPQYLSYNKAVDVSQTCGFSLKSGEGLSAFAFVKRMFDTIKDKPDSYFLKIRSVACMLLKSRLENNDHICLLENYKGDISEAVIDLNNSLELKDNEYSDYEIKIAQEIFEEIKKDNVKITSYYAIIKLDGDNMGNAYNNCADSQEQLELSTKTSKFASEAQIIASDNKGMCIFAGGEDILMFLPIDTLFSAITELYKKYPSIIGEQFTFSTGIVIAHFMQPLKDVMSRVYEAEKKAKNHCNEKNSFAIDLIKRSGEGVCVDNSFGAGCGNLNAFSDTVKKLYSKDFSHSYLYNLVNVLESIAFDGNVKCNDEMIEALIIQASKAKSKKEKDALSEIVFSLYKTFDKLSSFINSLKIIDFLSKEGKYDTKA